MRRGMGFEDSQLEIILREDFQALLVEFVDKRFARRDFDRDDLVGREVLEHHDNRAEGVAVSRDENAFAGVDFGSDFLIPIRFDAFGGVDEAFGERAIFDGHLAFFDEVLVFLLVTRPAFVIFGKGQRGYIGAATPDMDLFIAPLLRGFGFVEALKRAIVTFVEAPGIEFGDGIPFAKFLEGEFHRLVRTFEGRGEGDVEGVAFFFKQFACVMSFFYALLGKVHVGPAREKIAKIPFGLAVTDKDKFNHVSFGSFRVGDIIKQVRA